MGSVRLYFYAKELLTFLLYIKNIMTQIVLQPFGCNVPLVVTKDSVDMQHVSEDSDIWMLHFFAIAYWCDIFLVTLLTVVNSVI